MFYNTPLERAAVIKGNATLIMKPGKRESLETSVTWSPNDIALFAKQFGKTMDPSLVNGQVTINYLQQNGQLVNIDWTLKYHLEDVHDDTGKPKHPNVKEAQKEFDSLLQQAENSGKLVTSLQTLGSTKLNGVQGAKHHIKNSDEFPEHKGYTAQGPKLTKPVPAHPVQKPTMKPKKPPAKPPAKKPAGKKGGKLAFMDAFQSVIEVMARAFTRSF